MNNRKAKKKVVLTQQERETRYRVNRLRYRVQREVQTANKRIDRLIENDLSKSSNAYRYLERLHFDNKGNLVEKQGKDGKTKLHFKIDIRKTSWNELQSIDKVLTDFLNSKTSTSRGVRKAYTKRYKEYKESTGTQLTEQEYAEQFSSGLFQQYSNLYSSSQAVQFFQKARGNGLTTNDIQQIIENENNRDIQTPHRKMLEEIAKHKQKQQELENDDFTQDVTKNPFEV